jgi:hypothetical protein
MRSVRHVIGYLATSVAAGALGWLIHAPETPGLKAPDQPAQRMAQAQPMHSADQPLIAVSSDGHVTLRVEQQPLDWVLEQIAQQSGWSDVKQRATGLGTGAAAHASEVLCSEHPPVTRAQTEQLMQAIQRGSEADRFQGLLQARSDGAAVPDQVLKVLYETDGSERVRLLAFEAFLEPRSGDLAETRRALEAGLYVPSSVIQNEAKRRLDELTEMERADAASPQKSSP